MYVIGTANHRKAVALAENQNYLCFYCGCSMVLVECNHGEFRQKTAENNKKRLLHVEGSADVTLDHVKPKADGGNGDINNMVAACRRCNSARQDYPHDLFKALIVAKGMDWAEVKNVCKSFHKEKHAGKPNVPKPAIVNGTQRRRGWGAYEAPKKLSWDGPNAVPMHRRSPQRGR